MAESPSTLDRIIRASRSTVPLTLELGTDSIPVVVRQLSAVQISEARENGDAARHARRIRAFHANEKDGFALAVESLSNEEIVAAILSFEALDSRPQARANVISTEKWFDKQTLLDRMGTGLLSEQDESVAADLVADFAADIQAEIVRILDPRTEELRGMDRTGIVTEYCDLRIKQISTEAFIEAYNLTRVFFSLRNTDLSPVFEDFSDVRELPSSVIDEVLEALGNLDFSEEQMGK